MMLSRENLPKTRKLSIEKYQRVLTAAASKSEFHLHMAKRWFARNDLFFLLTYVCKRKDVNRDWLFDRVREVEANPNGNLDLWAREHYKSTIITFGLTLQDILASHGDDPEPRYNGREVTICILSYNRPRAKAFLRQIKVECETNQDLKDLFPEILWQEPKKEALKWSEDDGLVFKREGNPKESTVEASGLVDGMPTGNHYWNLTYDDVVTKESVTSPEMILKTTEAWELSDSLTLEGGITRYIGTIYAMFDTYHTMRERGIPARIHPCTSDGSEDWSKTVLLKPETLAEKRTKQGKYTFGAQMLLNPTAEDDQGFSLEWLKYWPATHADNLNVYIVVDPASRKKRDSKKKATNDYTAMWVIGIGGDKNYYVLDVIRDRLNLTERQRSLFSLHRKWRPLAVGYEDYGLQADIEHIEYVMEQENYRFTITPLGGPMAKPDRIKRLVPIFENGRIFLPENGIVRTDYEGRAVNLIQSFIKEEYETFPIVSHDDYLDALARILDPKMLITFPEPAPEAEPKWMQELEGEMSAQGNWLTA